MGQRLASVDKEVPRQCRLVVDLLLAEVLKLDRLTSHVSTLHVLDLAKELHVLGATASLHVDVRAGHGREEFD